MQILTDLSSLDGLHLGLQPQQFSIELKPGTDLASYIDALNTTFASTTAQAQPNTERGGGTIVAMEALVTLLTRTRRTRHRPRRRRTPSRLGRPDAHPKRVAHRVAQRRCGLQALMDAGNDLPGPYRYADDVEEMEDQDQGYRQR